MDKKKIEDELDSMRKKYMKFMKLRTFPHYDIIIQNISFDSDDKNIKVASAKYDFETKTHILTINPSIELNEYIIFHELTHILDTDQYAKDDINTCTKLLGYTEYHASQIELLNLLGTKKVDKRVHFKMNQIINTINGNLTVQKYIDIRHNQAIELFNKKSFPVNYEYLCASLTVLCNYFGLRSICKMYAKDYNENKNNDVFKKHMSSQLFDLLDSLMKGRMKDKEIKKTMMLFGNIINILSFNCK